MIKATIFPGAKTAQIRYETYEEMVELKELLEKAGIKTNIRSYNR